MAGERLNSPHQMSREIETPRLRMTSLSLSALKALADGDLVFAGGLLDADFQDSWAGHADAIQFRIADIEQDPSFLPWSMRAIVQKSDRRVVGSIGCHAKPGAKYSEHLQPAGVEFGYTVFEPYRRQGFAREALRGLMEWCQTNGASHFILSIAPDNHPSQSLARQFGFHKVGSQIDEKDGPEDILALWQSP